MVFEYTGKFHILHLVSKSINMKFLQLSCCLLVLILSSCTQDTLAPASDQESQLRTYVTHASPTNDLDYWVLPQSDDYESIPQEVKNPLNDSKVQLGTMLFYETAFSTEAVYEEGIGTYSCSSCHIPSAGFRPGSKQGIADGGVGFGLNGEARKRNTNYKESELDVQSARPLSMLNVAFVENTMWNGSFGSFGVNIGTEDKWVGDFHNNNLGLKGLEAQNIEGMKTHRMKYDKESISKYGYKELFDLAFPELNEEERYTTKTASFALSAYIRTLFPNEAPFQHWLKGNENAMSYAEKEGALLFFGKAGCTNCHNGEGFSSSEFHAVGALDMYQTTSYNTDQTDMRNFGRGGFTENETDYYKFRVPQLYNMSDTEFYFHGGSLTDLREVVKYFNDAESENPNVPEMQMSEYFKPLKLSEQEINQLTLFLEVSLRDPNLERYQPAEVMSGQCFPNADAQSILDMGCE